MSKNPKGLHYRLIVSYLTIIFIPLVVLGALSFFVSLSIVRTRTIEEDGLYLRQISQNVDSVVNHMQNTSLIAYSSTLLQEYIQDEQVTTLEVIGDPRIHNYLYSLKSANYNNYTYILKTYNSDVIYCNNYDYKIKQDYNFDKLDWVQKIKSETGSTVFVPTYLPDYFDNNQTPVFSIGRQLIDNYTLKPLGYIIINCNASIIDSIIGYDTSQVYIYNQYEQAVYTPGLSSQGNSNINKNLSISYKDISKKQIQSFNGENYLVTRLESENSKLTYIRITPLSDLTKDSTLIMQLTLLIIAIVIVVSLIVSLTFTRRISSPIDQMVYNMEETNVEESYQAYNISSNIAEFQKLNYHYNHLMERINNHIDKEYLSTIRQKDIEYKLLQSQINPHFLFNTLESIRMNAAINGDKETSEMIFNLASLYRYGVRVTTPLVCLKDELQHIDHYLYLQKLRFGDKFDYESNIDPASKNCEIPHLTLQPLVENCVNHGFIHKEQKGLIQVDTSFIDGVLNINVTDNGDGIETSKLHLLEKGLDQSHNQGHIGLLATKERIKHHFNKSDVTIKSTPGQGTLINIRINYK